MAQEFAPARPFGLPQGCIGLSQGYVMSIFRPIRAALFAVAGMATVAAAQDHSDSKVYDLTIAGIPLGTVTLDAEQTGREYTATSKISPNGLLNMVTGYAYDGRAVGRVDASGKVSPQAFEADSTSPRATRRTEIEWRDGAPIRVSVEPPRKQAPDPDHVLGALDPVSAGFALLRDSEPGDICNKVIEVFDGSRRSRLSLAKPKEADAGYLCNGSYARLEGEAHSLSDQKEYPFQLLFTPNGDGKVQLERIETQTRFGLAVVSRRG
jgi:hypothetical protein